MFLIVALHHDWPIHQLDVMNAFLHGKLDQPVYMSQPQGFEDKTFPDHVCLLHKAIYGLKQAPRLWFATLSTYLKNQNFLISSADPSFFHYHKDHLHIYILVYVDDILITGNDSSSITSLILNLQQKFQTRNLGHLSKFLGIEFHRSAAGYHLHQHSYIQDLLHTASMTNCKPLLTPLPSKYPVDQTLQLPFGQPDLFRKLAGSLQYLTSTRPDIAFAVNKLCQHMHNPLLLHFQLLKRVLRYLKGTLHHDLFLPKTDLFLSAYSDSDWAGDQLDRKSTTGYCIFLGSALLSWSVKKQTTVARSSTEAEYRSMAAAAADLIWTRRLCEDFQINLSSTELFCDNISAMSIACNPIFHARTKHIEVDHHFIRDCIQSNQITVRHISTTDQPADIFTKSLSSARLFDLRTKLLVLPTISLREGDMVTASSTKPKSFTQAGAEPVSVQQTCCPPFPAI
ncbi:hypothetical protein KFK09_009085 [Dendrobium nobile]|uniref:Reverse transcriptase Ty1/copia-type domain-containing protein n=1 Tax=Dendrobium nobile TaxID=94219 RepID=A0A8T3BRP4_DENNO|nr:hypothetical protein KFK09_009085 [Dendrobium nobile]